MKRVLSRLAGVAIMLVFIFGALFDDGGLGLTIEGYGWLNPIGDFVGNVAVLYAILSVLVAGIMMAAMIFSEKGTDVMAESAAKVIKKHDYDLQAAKKLYKFGVFWTSVSVVYWIFLVGAGWVFVGPLFAISGIAIYLVAAMNRRAFKEIEDLGLNRDELKERVDEILEDA